MLIVNATKIENKTSLTVVPHVCGICKKAFLEELSLLEHIKTHDIKSWEPSRLKLITSKATSNFSQEKLNTIKDIKTLNYSDNSKFEPDSSDKKLHVCVLCNRNFSSKTYLYKHIKLHKGDRAHKCEVCNKSFVLKDNLVKHSATHDPYKKRYFCLECGKGFTSRQYKEKHELIHLGEKPHACHVCKKAFTLKTNLNKHILIHSKERMQFSCSECGKGFSSKSYLVKHHLIHIGEKPHICGICQKAFTLKTNLHKHYVTHTSHKKHGCSVCNRSFKSKVALTKHSVLHSKPHKFKCLICLSVFNKDVDVEQHMLIHKDISGSEREFRDAISFRGDCVGLNEIIIESKDCEDFIYDTDLNP